MELQEIRTHDSLPKEEPRDSDGNSDSSDNNDPSHSSYEIYHAKSPKSIQTKEGDSTPMKETPPAHIESEIEKGSKDSGFGRKKITREKSKRKQSLAASTLGSKYDGYTSSEEEAKPKPVSPKNVDSVISPGMTKKKKKRFAIERKVLLKNVPLFLVALISAITFWVMYERYPDEGYVYAGYLWVFWGAFMSITFLLLRAIIGFIFFVYGRFFFFTKFYYFTNALTTNFVVIFWVAMNWPFWAALELVQQALRRDDRYMDVNVADLGEMRFYVSRIFLSLLLVAILRSVKIVIDKILIASFHRDKFWDQIYDSLKKERILKTLSKPPRRKSLFKGVLENAQHPNFKGAWSYINDSVDQQVRRDAQKIESNAVIKKEIAEVSNVIFENVDYYQRGGITAEDFYPFFKNEEESHEAFAFFDKNSDGTVTRHELYTTVKEIRNSRLSLYNTLHDRESIGAVVTRLLGAVFWIVMAVIVALIFGVNVNAVFLPFGTFLLAFAFVFGETLKSVWESFIFIFIIRPYDIGDRIQPEGYPVMLVSRINLLTTEAFAPDGRHFIMPHSHLTNVMITQMKRSKNYAIDISIDIHSETDMELLEELKSRLDQFLKTDQSAPWVPSWMSWVNRIENMNKIVVGFWVELEEVNWSIPRNYLGPKSTLLMKINAICKEIGIRYAPPTQEILVNKASKKKKHQ